MPVRTLNYFFFERSDSLRLQFLRYAVVGITAFVLDSFVLYLMTEYMGVNYLISNIFGFTVGLLYNYFLSVKWVFAARPMNNKAAEFIFIVTIGVIGLGLNELFLYTFTAGVGFHYLWSKLVASVCVYLWNFGARRWLLYSKLLNIPLIKIINPKWKSKD